MPETPRYVENNKPQLQLSLQEGVLALGMESGNDNATVNYAVDQSGVKKISVLEQSKISNLVDKFRHDPKEALARARNNLLAVMKDKNMGRDERFSRINRYLDAYFSLQVKLDREAFPSDGRVYSGVPDYIPDGLTDMGSDPVKDPSYRRGREKIRINKKEIFDESKDFFTHLFSQDYSNMSLEQIKLYFARYVGYYVYHLIPYDTEKADPFPNSERSVLLVEASKKKKGVCRHHALYSQVLMQSVGLTSRLFKCDVQFGERDAGAHACNLVRINNAWYLMDSTNPDVANGVPEVFIARIPETDIDLNNKDYVWRIKRKDGRTYTYHSRKNMFYTINDNVNNKVQY